MQVDTGPFRVQTGDLRTQLLPVSERLLGGLRTQLPIEAVQHATALGASLSLVLRDMRRAAPQLQQQAAQHVLLKNLQVRLHSPVSMRIR